MQNTLGVSQNGDGKWELDYSGSELVTPLACFAHFRGQHAPDASPGVVSGPRQLESGCGPSQEPFSWPGGWAGPLARAKSYAQRGFGAFKNGKMRKRLEVSPNGGNPTLASGRR